MAARSCSFEETFQKLSCEPTCSSLSDFRNNHWAIMANNGLAKPRDLNNKSCLFSSQHWRPCLEFHVFWATWRFRIDAHSLTAKPGLRRLCEMS
eukprot:608780-Amphidinium_carterae.1